MGYCQFFKKECNHIESGFKCSKADGINIKLAVQCNNFECPLDLDNDVISLNSIEFDYDKIMQKNTVVHCDTEEKADKLLKWADSQGLRWSNGDSYLTVNEYFNYKEKTCYDLVYGLYGSLDRFNSKYFAGRKLEEYTTILEYEDIKR